VVERALNPVNSWTKLRTTLSIPYPDYLNVFSLHILYVLAVVPLTLAGLPRATQAHISGIVYSQSANDISNLSRSRTRMCMYMYVVITPLKQ